MAEIYGKFMSDTYLDNLFGAENSPSNIIAFCTFVHPPVSCYLQFDLSILLPKLRIQNGPSVIVSESRRIAPVVCT